MANEVETYILDACALIAYLRKEEGCDKLRVLLKDSNNRFFIHAVNLGEVYYNSLRVSGKEKAKTLFEDIRKLPINIIWTLDIYFIELAGKYKASFKMSYADSFVLALAEREGGTVISTDHHEFDSVENAKWLPFYWLR